VSLLSCVIVAGIVPERARADKSLRKQIHKARTERECEREEMLAGSKLIQIVEAATYSCSNVLADPIDDGMVP
jgi:hypothetical protein